MEEKLRNLSQNIANNTGPREADRHEEPAEDHISDEELRDAPQDDGNERIDADYTDEEAPSEAEEEQAPEENHEEQTEEPAPESHKASEDSIEEPADEPHEENEEGTEKAEETESHEEATPAEDEAAPVAISFKPVKEQEEAEEYDIEEPAEPENYDIEPEKTEDSKEPDGPKTEEPAEPETKPEAPVPAKAAILTMNEEDDIPQESPTRTKKYSPEVEAALSRIGSEDSASDIQEPLSTEPRKEHHAGRILLFILFVLALAVGCVCILVEQGIIDNPFPNLFKKDSETSETQPADNTPTKPAEKYLEIAEWGVKVLRPEGIKGFWYEPVEGKENEIQIFGTNSSFVADEGQEANATMKLIRSFEDTLTYSESLTLSPLTNISGHYYYLILTSGEMDDEVVTLFNDNLLNNSRAILAL